MYAYPGYVSDELIETMARHSQILPYLDMPLQHGHRRTLKRMKRPANIEWVHRTIQKLRTTIPGLAIRSTFIVGYPGETEAEFQTLMGFVNDLKFDRLGAFEFSFETGTASEPLADPIPQPLKSERRRRLMELRERISLQKNLEFVGQTLDVIIEGTGDGLSVGRSYPNTGHVPF